MKVQGLAKKRRRLEGFALKKGGCNKTITG
jgi:hypothetical protein